MDKNSNAPQTEQSGIDVSHKAFLWYSPFRLGYEASIFRCHDRNLRLWGPYSVASCWSHNRTQQERTGDAENESNRLKSTFRMWRQLGFPLTRFYRPVPACRG